MLSMLCQRWQSSTSVILSKVVAIISVLVVFQQGCTAKSYDLTHLCPNGFVGFHHSCYKFMRMKGTWTEAETYCQAMQAHLVSIQSWRENYYILEHIRRNKKKFEKSSFWIGGNDLANEGEWRWVANNHAMDFTSWYTYQPDNGGSSNRVKHAENCMELERKYGYQWNDQPCHMTNNFICEIELES